MRFFYLFVFGLLFFACEAFKKAPPARGPASGLPPISDGSDPYFYDRYPPGTGPDQSLYDPSRDPFNNSTHGPSGGSSQNPTGGSAQNSSNDPSQDPSVPKTEWGVLKCHESQVQVFNEELRKFLSPTIDPARISAVNCTGRKDLKGGVWIRGRINFENSAVYDLNSNQELNVSTDSYLEIHVVDITGRPVVAFRMNAVPFGGSVQGNYVALAFQDGKSKVYIDGTVEDNYILSGTFRYENFTTRHGGAQGYSGQLGFHSIHVCSLLNCG